MASYPIPPGGRWIFDQGYHGKTWRWHNGRETTGWVSMSGLLVYDFKDRPKELIESHRPPTWPPPDPPFVIRHPLEYLEYDEPLPDPRTLRCNGLYRHDNVPRCEQPVDVIVELGSSFGDGLLPTCAAHIFHLDHAGKGLYLALAIVVDGGWTISSSQSASIRHVGVDAERPRIRGQELESELARRVRAQLPIALAAPRCEHNRSREFLYSCDLTVRTWASTGYGWPRLPLG